MEMVFFTRTPHGLSYYYLESIFFSFPLNYEQESLQKHGASPIFRGKITADYAPFLLNRTSPWITSSTLVGENVGIKKVARAPLGLGRPGLASRVNANITVIN